MIARRVGVASVMTGLAVVVAQPGQARSRAPSLVFRDVTIIDGTGSPAMPHQDLLVTGSHIAAIGPTGTLGLPAGTEVVETRGRYVMPGLIDAHVHLATFPREAQIQDALLRYALLGGVTTVRDMGGSISELQAIASRTRVAAAPLPRFVYSAVLSGPQSMWFTSDRREFLAGGSAVGQSPGVRLVDSTADVRQVVADARATGASGLKLYANLSPRTIAAVSREAHRQGLRVWAHFAMWPGRPSDVVARGVDVVSHAPMFMRELVPEVPPGAPSAVVAADRRVGDSVYRAPSATTPAIARLLQEMRRGGTILDATLYVVLSASREASDPAAAARYRDVFRYSAAMTRAAHAAGVPVVAGTDAIGRNSPNIHTELQLLTDSAGFTPLEALRSATQVAARALGMADSTGTLQRGKLADLVVLDGDPSIDIANTMRVDLVMRGGVIHRRTSPMPRPSLAREPRP